MKPYDTIPTKNEGDIVRFLETLERHKKGFDGAWKQFRDALDEKSTALEKDLKETKDKLKNAESSNDELSFKNAELLESLEDTNKRLNAIKETVSVSKDESNT